MEIVKFLTSQARCVFFMRNSSESWYSCNIPYFLISSRCSSMNFLDRSNCSSSVNSSFLAEKNRGCFLAFWDPSDFNVVNHHMVRYGGDKSSNLKYFWFKFWQIFRLGDYVQGSTNVVILEFYKFCTKLASWYPGPTSCPLPFWAISSRYVRI